MAVLVKEAVGMVPLVGSQPMVLEIRLGCINSD